MLRTVNFQITNVDRNVSAAHCGTILPAKLSIDTTALELEFFSDPSLAGNGYKLQYEIVSQKPPDGYAALYLTPYKMTAAKTYLIIQSSGEMDKLASEDHCLTFDAYINGDFYVLITNSKLVTEQVLLKVLGGLGLHFTRHHVLLQSTIWKNVGKTARLVFLASAGSKEYSEIHSAITNFTLTAGSCSALNEVSTVKPSKVYGDDL